MKVRAFILIVIWTVLTVELAFGNFSSNIAKADCSKKKATSSACSKPKPVESPCAKSKCSKPEPAEEKEDCGASRCNPLMSCPTGNFYLAGHANIILLSLTTIKQKTPLVNDNRISKQLSECWHPPEII